MLYIFDADGTLRRTTTPDLPYPTTPDEWEVIPGVLQRMHAIDWGVEGFGIASNQSGVALGHLTAAMAKRLLVDLAVEVTGRKPRMGAIQFCTDPHDKPSLCRKPAPTMLQRVMRAWWASPKDTLFVGDRDTDQGAARNAGVGFAWAWDFFGVDKGEWMRRIGVEK